jgi:hypothetical protein
MATLGSIIHPEVQRYLDWRGASLLGPLNIETIYDCFHATYDASADTPASHFQCLPFSGGSMSTELVGIDLPILMSTSSTSYNAPTTDRKVAMIVGQDPLRHPNDFPPADEYSDKLIFGTPYAFHSRLYREGRTKLYGGIVDILLKTHDAYLTDVHKIGHLIPKKQAAGAIWKRPPRTARGALLSKEFNLMKPDLVVLLGKIAQEAYQDLPSMH